MLATLLALVAKQIDLIDTMDHGLALSKDMIETQDRLIASMDRQLQTARELGDMKDRLISMQARRIAILERNKYR